MVRQVCALHSCAPPGVGQEFVSWQTALFEVLVGPYEQVWWLYAPVLLVCALAVVIASSVAVGLAGWSGERALWRWVIVTGGVGVLAVIGAMVAFTSEIEWVNTYLE